MVAAEQDEQLTGRARNGECCGNQGAGMKKVVLALLILGLALLACLGSLRTPGEYKDKFGGEVSTYVRILEMTDCTELQREFERADEAVKLQEPGTPVYQESIGYRTAAENRMKEVECAGDL
jgi:hypothetical protein